MSKPDETNWETFGFPEPGFMPAWKPAEGLMKALAERNLPFASEWDFETIAEEDQLEIFLTTGHGQSWCKSFDNELKQTAVRYLNHLKMDDLTELTDVSSIMWTWDDLLLEAADGNEDDIVDPKKGDFSPEWNLKWLLQRQKAINLLLYAPVPFQYDYLSGSTHTGVPSSPAESIAAALSGMTPGKGSGLPSTYVNNIYGPDHGWREGSYCCNVAVTKKIYANLPEGFEPEGNVYMTIKVTGADGSDESFTGGGSLSVGMNVLTADQDGVFIEFTDTDLANVAGTPTKDHETSGGWRATVCQAFADYTSKFQFKDEDSR